MMYAAAERHRFRSRLLPVLAGLLLAWVAWRILTLAMAEPLSRTGPDAARAAIKAAPLDGRGYRSLALQAEASGNQPLAVALYRLAAARGPRDLASLGWLANQALTRGDDAQALGYLDQMLRVQPELSKQLYPALMSLSLRPASQKHVATILLRDPPWRASFVPQLIQQSPNSGSVFNLIEILRNDPAGLTKPELSIWLDRLVKEREWGTAYLSWVGSLPPEARQRIGNVYNGSFELEPSQLGFDWRFGRVPGARLSRAQVSGGEGRLALRVAFEDRRVPFQHVRQLLALAPGSYRLTGRVRLDELRSERGLVWALSCADDGKAIAESDPMSGRSAWREFTLDLVVPAEGCGGQWLTLRVPARIPAEQRIGGVAWFDDVKIESTLSQPSR